MADRPLSGREREILLFLLSLPEMRDGDVLRRQAEVATTPGRSCPCGCASIGLKVDPSAASQARLDRRRFRIDAMTEDIAGVHERVPLVFLGKDGRFDPSVVPTEDDFYGYIGLMLWVDGGWLDDIEVHSVGNFRNPRTFPPADLFELPSVTSPA